MPDNPDVVGQALVYVNAVVVALNHMYGITALMTVGGTWSQAQGTALSVIVGACQALALRLSGAPGGGVDGGWADYGRGGATKPLESEPGTIRGDLAVNIGRNVIHGSDAPETAEFEIGLWFQPSELNDWSPSDQAWRVED